MSIKRVSLLKAIIITYNITGRVKFATSGLDDTFDGLAKLSQEHAITAVQASNATAEAKVI